MYMHEKGMKYGWTVCVFSSLARSPSARSLADDALSASQIALRVRGDNPDSLEDDEGCARSLSLARASSRSP